MEKIQASHILVETEDRARELYDRLNRGEDFGKLAAENSRCPSSRNGGDLGFFGRGQMVSAFETAAFECPVGQVVGPVQTQFGYHLIKRTQ